MKQWVSFPSSYRHQAVGIITCHKQLGQLGVYDTGVSYWSVKSWRPGILQGKSPQLGLVRKTKGNHRKRPWSVVIRPVVLVVLGAGNCSAGKHLCWNSASGLIFQHLPTSFSFQKSLLVRWAYEYSQNVRNSWLKGPTVHQQRNFGCRLREMDRDGPWRSTLVWMCYKGDISTTCNNLCIECYTILYYTILYYIKLYIIILYYIRLYYIILYIYYMHTYIICILIYTHVYPSHLWRISKTPMIAARHLPASSSDSMPFSSWRVCDLHIMNLKIAGKWTFNDVNKNQNLLKVDIDWYCRF